MNRKRRQFFGAQAGPDFQGGGGGAFFLAGGGEVGLRAIECERSGGCAGAGARGAVVRPVGQEDLAHGGGSCDARVLPGVAGPRWGGAGGGYRRWGGRGGSGWISHGECTRDAPYLQVAEAARRLPRKASQGKALGAAERHRPVGG